MTGIAVSMRGCVAAQVEDFGRIVTVGEQGSGEFHLGVYGYLAGSYGALNANKLRGATLLAVRTLSVGESPQLFNVTIQEIVADDFFESIIIQKGDGSFITLDTDDADFSTGSGASVWIWGESGSVSTWSIPDIGQKRVVRFR